MKRCFSRIHIFLKVPGRMPGREGGGQALGVGPEDEPVSDEVGPCPDRVGVHNELSAPQVRN